jgi:ANTAR domain
VRWRVRKARFDRCGPILALGAIEPPMGNDSDTGPVIVPSEVSDLVAHASIAVTPAVQIFEVDTARLQQVLRSRDIISCAQGVIMARHHLKAEDADAFLRRTAVREDRRLLDVAAEVVASTREPTDPAGAEGHRP